jgi:hypothetical protein
MGLKFGVSFWGRSKTDGIGEQNIKENIGTQGFKFLQ